MRRIVTIAAAATFFVTATAPSALARYTEGPAPTNEVEGVGGGAAFTGGDVSVAVVTTLALVVVGLVALFMARRRTRVTS
jgi:hypothetical protein